MAREPSAKVKLEAVEEVPVQVRTESAHRAGGNRAQIAAPGASVKKLFEATFFKMSPARQPGEEQPVGGEPGQVLTEPADEIRSQFNTG